MKYLLMLCLTGIVGFVFLFQTGYPDLTKKDDLHKLGVGRIIETDNTIITNIALYEVKEYWIVYIKDESLHDLSFERINRLEFRNSKWGPLKIKFPNNRPQITNLSSH